MADIDLDLISRCLSGRSTEWERSRYERWLVESPDHLTLVEAVRAVAIDGRSWCAPGS